MKCRIKTLVCECGCEMQQAPYKGKTFVAMCEFHGCKHQGKLYHVPVPRLREVKETV